MFVRIAFLLITTCGFVAAQQPSTPTRRVVFTIDDLPTVSVLGNEIGEAQRVTRDLVAALVRNKIPAIGFVNEQKLRSNGAVDPRRVDLLQQWIDAGLELGNHTYSHPDLHYTPVAEFERQVLEGERVTRPLLRAAGMALRYFRHPFLHTGRDSETRGRLEAFLQRHGYRVAPVTIDNYDYMYAAAFDRATANKDNATREKVVAAYLTYMESVIAYYEQQAQAILGRDIPQTLLLHANSLNAKTLDDLARIFIRRGYRFVHLEEALTDPAYGSADNYYGPAGITWLHRWAITEGKPRTIFDGEPAVPDWIARGARIGGQ